MIVSHNRAATLPDTDKYILRRSAAGPLMIYVSNGGCAVPVVWLEWYLGRPEFFGTWTAGEGKLSLCVSMLYVCE